MSKDFIKWLAEYADGFKYDNTLIIIGSFAFGEIEIQENVIYPLLLQRAIEGINKDLDKFEIFQNPCCIWVRDKRYGLTSIQNYYFEDIIHKDEPYILCDTPDQAKESALKYIMEKEIDTQ